jgi:hypothetical protein
MKSDDLKTNPFLRRLLARAGARRAPPRTRSRTNVAEPGVLPSAKAIPDLAE